MLAAVIGHERSINHLKWLPFERLVQSESTLTMQTTPPRVIGTPNANLALGRRIAAQQPPLDHADSSSSVSNPSMTCGVRGNG